METASSNLELELTQELSKYTQRNQYEYDSVTVLLLFWAEDDLGVIDEIMQLTSMFRDIFHYSVRQFVIPSDRSEATLCREVNAFVYEFGLEDSLIVVYYSGHGDPDRQGEQESVWAAKTHGGPTLRWYQIQPVLSMTEGDVLLVLDCCYAGQAARMRSTHKFELLAAAAMNLLTPGPKGPHNSFTSVLISEMTRMATDNTGFLVSTLHASMVKKEARLKQQPFYTLMAGALNGSIRLRPLNGATFQSEPRSRYADVAMSLSLFQKPTSDDKDLLLRWMTTNRPSNISAIRVEKVFVEAKANEQIGKHYLETNRLKKAGQDTTSKGILTPEAITDIEHGLDVLGKELAAPLSGHDLEPNSIAHATNTIEEKSQALHGVLEDNICELSSADLHYLLGIADTKTAGMSQPIDLRLILLDAVSVPKNNISSLIKFASISSKPDERWRRGTLNGSPILLEYWYYDSRSTAGALAPAAVIEQISKIATLLAKIRNPAFRTFSGCGYTHEILHGPRFGMAYSVPPQHAEDDFNNLYDLLTEVPLVPLGTRIKLARALVASILHFHIIGWVHKGIKSANVVLFSNKSSERGARVGKLRFSDVDFLAPWICGFDYSRLEAAESWLDKDFRLENNLYRHPERWGKPVKFQKKHDIYALGVLLLEIGSWKLVSDMDPQKKDFRNRSDPEHVKSVLVTLAGDNLAHRTGKAYATATRFCLTYDLSDATNNSSAAGLKLFRRNVLTVLDEACMLQ